jgi:hypothetical protein
MMLSEINELAEDPAKKFLWMTLIMAHEDHASEVIFGTATGGAVPIFYKVNCAWYDMAPFPVKIWQSVRANLISMTNFDSSQEYPRHGVLDQDIGRYHLHWNLTMQTPDGPLELFSDTN